ncbi:MAG TPA: ABC transporter permease, partial [Chitinophagaceae bacterium]|nr:ABC transporter permease [Chitinophagaceae bacterium]
MISNYLKTACRSLARHKGYTLINITGLAIGIAACLVLFLVVRYELSYDKFQPSYSRIGRVITQDKFSDGITYNSGIPVPALEVLRTQMPDITFGSLLSSFGSQVTVLADDKASAQKMFIEETGVFFSDAQFFNVFSYKWLNGEPGVLSKPNTIVLTRKIAEKYFGHWENAPGKLLKLDNILTFEVAGVLENVPGNTDFPLAVMASIETLRNNSYNYNYYPDWNSTSSNYQVYVLLPDGKSI